MKKQINHIFFGIVFVCIQFVCNLNASADLVRMPANYIPDDEISTNPIENSIWLNQVLVKDNAGVLEGVANDIQRWQDAEEFEQQWGVRREVNENIPNREQKMQYLNRQMMRYLDKRLTGEVKKAEKGSALHKVGTVQKALKPNTTVAISKKFKLRFKARLLQRNASIYVVNPYFNNSLDINSRGRAVLRMSKHFNPLKIDSNLRVDFQNKQYASSLSRPVTKKVRAFLSTQQRLNDAPFTSTADNRLEFRYFTRF